MKSSTPKVRTGTKSGHTLPITGKKSHRDAHTGQAKVQKFIDQMLFSHTRAERGISASVARNAEKHGLTRDDIRMVIPDRTLERRLAAKEVLKLEEADGIARLLRVVSHARRTFGDNDLAAEWLRSPNPALDEQIPIRMARTDLGGREVEIILGRIEHGIFS